MSDLDQFKTTYITECFELLEEMEEKLLNLDEGDADLEELNAIFRCAHSIKGGAGAFGFDRLVNFTHILEFLLDAMREGAVTATQEVIDALLKAVDVVTQLVAAAQQGTELPEDFESHLTTMLNELSGGQALDVESLASSDETTTTEGQACVSEKYHISFIPSPTLFASGNEPLLIIRELQKIGNVSVECDIDHIPNIEQLDCEECYLSWKLTVDTDKGLDAIHEAFEFVEDECQLTIEKRTTDDGKQEQDSQDLSANDEFGGVFDDAWEEVKEGGVQSANDKDTPQKATPAAQKANVETLKKGATVTSIRVDIEKVDTLVNMVGELVITQAMLTQQTKDLPPDQFHALIQGVDELTRHTRELQDAVMAVRMQPVKSVFARMPRIVRDLSGQLGKDVRLEMFGENTEIDKTVIEQLGDPLTHMIRNSVDHGIETPDERTKNNKDSQGVIRLSADNSGGRINIEIEDDGDGINRERVLAKAIEKGLVSKEAHLVDEEIDNLVFHPGFSTAAEVTDVSGRGVGMDVVKRNIADLGGTIELENNPGQGTKFTVSLPLTLAILDGMIVRVGTEHYIVPINNIIESMRPKEGEVQSVADGSDVMNVRGEFVPILYLYQIFNVGTANTDPSKYLVVLVESGRNRIGLVVDELVGQQQVVIKNIEENSDPVEGVSGATILGDGNVSLILDIAQLQRMTIADEFKTKQAA